MTREGVDLPMPSPVRLDGSNHFSPPLHGLRGVAVLYVVVSHVGSGLLPLTHHGIGKVGVWIFFALSAYLLTHGLGASLRGAGRPWPAIGAYFVHRVCRIYPMLLLVLAVHMLIGDMSFAELLQHVALVAGRGELWAIPVEFSYYLVIPCFALLARSRSSSTMLMLLAAVMTLCVLGTLYAPERVFSNGLALWPRMPPFLVGSALALYETASLHRRQLPCGRMARSGLAWAVALLALTLLYRMLQSGRIGVHWAPALSFVLALLAGWGIVLVQQPGWLGRVMASRPLVFIGRVSFSLYLTHMVVFDGLDRALGWSGPARAWSALLAAIVVAALGYRFVELPGIRLGKAWGSRWLGRRADRVREAGTGRT